MTTTKMENVRGRNTKRKHLSKNKKKSWRHVDTEDVEEFLEDERLQERTGGKVSEKKDEALFVLDSSKLTVGKTATQRKSDRKRKAQDLIENVEIGLKPPPSAKKDKRPKHMIDRLTNRALPDKFIEAKQQRKASKIQSVKKAKEKPHTSTPQYDLWADDCKLDKELVNEDPHFLDVTRKRRVKVPKHYNNRPSLIPAVETPHPGASYNPAFDEYQQLLLIAHSKEEKKLQLEERIQRALYGKFPSIEEAPTEASKLEEMSAGLFDDESDESSDSDAEQDLDKISVNPPVRRENKKDERKRKKEKVTKNMEKKLKEEKNQRIRNNEIYRLKTIKREIKDKEDKTNKKIRRKQEGKLQEPYMTKRLGKEKFKAQDLEIKLSDELVGSLRELKPEGDLLVDRIKSLQKRNVIEPRVRQSKRKNKKIKYVEKRKHREIQS